MLSIHRDDLGVNKIMLAAAVLSRTARCYADQRNDKRSDDDSRRTWPNTRTPAFGVRLTARMSHIGCGAKGSLTGRLAGSALFQMPWTIQPDSGKPLVKGSSILSAVGNFQSDWNSAPSANTVLSYAPAAVMRCMAASDRCGHRNRMCHRDPSADRCSRRAASTDRSWPSSLGEHQEPSCPTRMRIGLPPPQYPATCEHDDRTV